MQRIDRYELRGELGRGALGVVYRAWDPDAHEEVALKVLLGAARLAPEDLQRFRTEAAAGAALQHPGIVRVRDGGQVDGLPFLVLDLVPGGSLAERLRREGPLAPAEAARIAERLARALAHAHARGVVHRDVKPANVLLDRLGEPLLTDFGLARVASGDRLTHSGDVLGTPSYMPPEQAAGERARIGPWSDVYSLGATLYEMLTGQRPFNGPTALAILDAVARGSPPRVEALRPQVDPALAELCHRAMARVPAQRFLSADDLADALAGWQRTAGRGGRARARRRSVGPAIAAVVAGGAALTGVGVALSWGAGRPSTGTSTSTSTGTSTSPSPSTSTSTSTSPSTSPSPSTSTSTSTSPSTSTSTAATPPVPARTDEATAARVLRPIVALMRRDPAAARRACDEAIEGHPGLAPAYVIRAGLRREAGDERGALEDMDRAVAIDPGPRTYVARGHTRYLTGDVPGARADVDRAIELAPDDPSGWSFRAQLEAEAGEVDAALADLQRALALGDDPGLRIARAGVLVDRGEPALALADLDRAEALQPSAPLTHLIEMRRALALLGLGRFVEALAASDRAVAADRTDSRAWSTRSEACLRLGREEEAVRSAERAVELDPGDALAAFRLARALLRLEVPAIDRGLAEAERGAGLAPEGTALRERLRGCAACAEAMRAACEALSRGEVQEARRIHEALARAVPDSADSWIQLGMFGRHTGDLALAARALDQALAIDPRDLLALELRAGFGTEAEALPYVDRALALSPDDVTLRGLRFELLLGLGRAAEAQAELDRTVAAPAPEAMDLVRRARARMRKNDDAGARLDLDEALRREPHLDVALLDRGHLLRFSDPRAALLDLETALAGPLSERALQRARTEHAAVRRALEGDALEPCPDHPHGR